MLSLQRSYSGLLLLAFCTNWAFTGNFEFEISVILSFCVNAAVVYSMY